MAGADPPQGPEYACETVRSLTLFVELTQVVDEEAQMWMRFVIVSTLLLPPLIFRRVLPVAVPPTWIPSWNPSKCISSRVLFDEFSATPTGPVPPDALLPTQVQVNP